MDVEALAVAHLNTLLGRCAHVKAYIAMNDKTPFTDGHIDLYSELPQSNATWAGRVAVQVKGRSGVSKKPLSKYPIARTELIAFQRDSGVLYFVVAIDPKTGRSKPYYALLSPFAIKAILDDVPKTRKRVSVPIRALPEDLGDLERIVWLALQTKDQNVEAGFDSALLERIESFSVYTSSTLDVDAPVVLTSGVNDFALVLHTVDGMSIPVGGELSIMPAQYIERSIDLLISSGEVEYAQASVKRTDQESFVLRLGQGLTLSFRETPGQLSAGLNLTLADSLAARLKATRFFMSLVETKSINIAGRVNPVNITTVDDDGWLEAHLAELSEMDELFEKLGVDTELVDLTLLDETQARQLRVLHRALVRGEQITSHTAGTSRALQQLGSWHLLLLVTPGEGNGKWEVSDPFDLGTRRQFQLAAGGTDGGEFIPVTSYDIVGDEHVGTILNMRLGSIVGAYEAIADVPTTFDLANQRVLALIRAADTQTTRRDALLGAAEDLNEWLIKQQGDRPHHLVNRWQIQARGLGLSSEQRSEVRRLKRQAARNLVENSEEFEFACALLLGDHEEADHLLCEIPPARRELMHQWPIWALRAD